MVDDETMVRAMRVAAANGGLAMVHAENGGAIAALTEAALGRGETGPRFHATTRPAALEAEATGRAIELAALVGCPLYVVHVSCEAALAEVDAGRAAGHEVWAETCPQYLFTTAEDLDRPGFEGGKYIFTPPPRTPADQEVLWGALAGGRLDAVTSDHCPFRWADQKTLGKDDFSKIPNGAPGIEERLALLHHFGVGAGRFSLSRLVELVSTGPARMFGLHPRKGTIAPGADADLVVFDPARRHTISAATHHSRVDYSLYEGFEVVGAVRDVLLRGNPVVRDGEPVEGPPGGELLSRAPFGSSLPMRDGGAA
jgi:dihydropyrimidinase